MSVAQEENFPRGGRKPVKRKFSEIEEKRSENLFSKPEPARKKKRNRNPKNTDHRALLDSNASLQVKAVDIMSYQKLQEGMLLLGCVHNIKEMSLHMELPGLIFGDILIKYISDSYLQHLNECLQKNDTAELEKLDLAKLFKVGQYMPVKVISKEETDKGCKVNLSTNPSDINSEITHAMIEKGMVLWACVTEKSDHCYQLDAGIKNCRIVLPFKAIDEGVEYIVGQPLWCIVRRSDVLKEATTVVASTKRKEVSDAVVPDDTPLYKLIPGSQVECTVEMVVKNGLTGKILNNVVGHIYESYLKTPFDTIKNYSEDTLLMARVLYIEPTTKFIKLSLRGVDTNETTILPIGSLSAATVIAHSPRGLTLRLDGQAIGFVTYKRIIKTLPKRIEQNVNILIQKKYPLQSTHRCRILDYNHLEMKHICTFEAAVLKERIFMDKDLKLGQVVQGKITKIEETGIEFKVGNLVGFIPNIHICNAQYSENIKKKYKEGQMIKAKYFEKFKDSNRFTLKQAFIESESCLTNYNDAKKHKQFPGLVGKITQTGILVIFYGGVKGWLPKTLIGEGQIYSPRMFYEGQVIMTTVFKIDETNRMTLTMEPPRPSKKQRLQLGQKLDGVVVGVEDNQLLLKVGPNKADAVLPYTHLTFDAELAKALLKTYSYNNTFKDLMVISAGETNVVSLKESLAYKHYNLKVPRADSLRFGDLIYCSFETKDLSGIEVSSSIKGCQGVLRIYREDVHDDEDSFEDIHFNPQQGVLAKIKAMRNDLRDTLLTTKMSDVFDYDYRHSIFLLNEYLAKCDVLRQHLTKRKHPITKCKIGQHITCVINKISESGCSVILQNGAEGLVAANHVLKGQNLKSGQTRNAVILYIDYVKEYLEVSLLPKVISKIDQKQDGKIEIGSVQRATLLLIRSKYAVAVLKDSKRIVLLPTIRHENDFIQEYEYYQQKLNGKITVYICNKLNKLVVGFENRIKKEWRYKNAHIQKVKPKRNRSTNGGVQAEEESESDEGIESSRNESSDVPEIGNSTSSLGDGDLEMEAASGEEDDASCEVGEEHEMEDASGEEDDETELEDTSGEKNGEPEMEDASGEEDDETELEDASGENNGEPEMEDASGEEDDDEPKMEEASDVEEDGSQMEEASIGEEGEFDDNTASGEQDVKMEEGEEGSSSNDEELDESNDDVKLEESKDDDNKEQGLEMKDNGEPKVVSSVAPSKNENTLFPGVQSFFNVASGESKKAESSDDESDDDKVKLKRKAKLTAEKIRIEEERVLQLETKIADESGPVPQTPREFEAALLADPNSSRLWVLYITSLAADGELDKARAKARKALETIAVEKCKEKFNVWMAYLNLENMFGDEESFDKVFQEAVVYNDPIQVYLAAIETLAESQKYVEMEEKIRKMKGKYKQNPDMYLKLAKIYFQCKKFQEARNLQAVAIKYVPEKQKHLNLLVQFAVLEFKFGDPEHGESVFETIIQTDPSRVDVWCTYVDQLVKLNKISLARKVLNRAVSNKLHVKKLKVLLKKFHSFEKAHGDEKTMQEFKDLAARLASEPSS